MTRSEDRDVWTIRDVLQWTSQKFAALNFETPLLDAQLLLCHVLKCRKIDLYIHADKPLLAEERAKLRELVKRRLQGEPVAYILQQKSWYQLDLYVDNRVLIPRPETELMVDWVLGFCKAYSLSPKLIVDLCTGSGCLALALARAFPDAECVAVDICPRALEVAKINAKQHDCTNITFLEADVTSAAWQSDFLLKYPSIDILVANPPYVSFAEWELCNVSVKNYEPIHALVAEEEGRKIGRAICERFFSPEVLSSKGIAIMELGVGHPTQLGACQTLSIQHAFDFYPRNRLFALRDLAQKERFCAYICSKS